MGCPVDYRRGLTIAVRDGAGEVGVRVHPYGSVGALQVRLYAHLESLYGSADEGV